MIGCIRICACKDKNKKFISQIFFEIRNFMLYLQLNIVGMQNNILRIISITVRSKENGYRRKTRCNRHQDT